MSRIPSLDGIRAVSICLVLFGHLAYALHINSTVSDTYAHAGVLIFFVISGYLITTLMQKEEDLSVKKFYLRRAWRILPAFYAFLIPVSLLGHYSTRELLLNWGYMASYATHFVHPSWNLYHLWSLSVEEQFYILWPIAFVFGLQKQVAWGTVILSPIFRYWMMHRMDGYLAANFFFPAVADSIAAGCLLALYWKRIDIENYRFMRVPILLCGLVFLPLAIYLNELHVVRPIPQIIGHLRWTLFNFFAVCLVAVLIQTRPRLLNHRFIVWFGILSYSLYLWQMPFMNPAITLPWEVRLSLTFITALASFYLVEVPMLIIRENGLKKTWKLTMWTLSRPRWSQRNNGEVFRRRMLQWMENEPQ
jgi:peptidoglycan/LPS O-acetylase OafA/YrhL